jgi:predicted nucleic acid-binding protein
LHVPALCDLEIAAGLRRGLLRRAFGDDRAALALRHYRVLPLMRHGHQSLLTRVLELRENFTAYDAAYVALAEQLRANLLTADEPLARAVRLHTAITVLP